MQVARETVDAPRRPEHVAAEKRGDVDIKGEGMMTTTNYYYYHGRSGDRGRGVSLWCRWFPSGNVESESLAARVRYGRCAAQLQANRRAPGVPLAGEVLRMRARLNKKTNIKTLRRA